jgi:pimeloyl-ACP methyl ester carboxylesterase
VASGAAIDNSPVEPQTVYSPRGKLVYWEVGSGPEVLCLHGFPDHAIGILPLAQRVADAGYRCICPALPGFSPSSAVSDGDYGVEALAGDLIALIDGLGLARPALIGHDWGGAIGYFLGSRCPERIASLVALGVPHPAGFSARRSAFAELRTAWYAIFLAYSPHAAEIAREPAWLTALVQSWSPGFYWQQWPAVLEYLRRPGVLEAVCSYYQADLDAELDLAPVRVPTTIIHGGQDGCIRPIAFHGLDGWFTDGVTVEMLPTVGHWPHLEDSGSTVRLIVDGLHGAG